jgi:hypothetical protein
MLRPIEEPRTSSKRLFVACHPLEGANEIHCYKPPFGLHVYDHRFRNAAVA